MERWIKQVYKYGTLYRSTNTKANNDFRLVKYLEILISNIHIKKYGVWVCDPFEEESAWWRMVGTYNNNEQLRLPQFIEWHHKQKIDNGNMD